MCMKNRNILLKQSQKRIFNTVLIINEVKPYYLNLAEVLQHMLEDTYIEILKTTFEHTSNKIFAVM